MVKKSNNNLFTGIGVSPGVVIGKAFTLDRDRIEIPVKSIDEKDIDREIARFDAAVKASIQQLERIKKNMKRQKIKEPQLIIETYIMILSDPSLHKKVQANIRQKRINAEWALKKTTAYFQKAFDNIGDAYLRERMMDINYIANRIHQNLGDKISDRIEEIREKVIVVAHDLSPADTAQMNKNFVMGFVTEIGGKTSHTAIMARSLEIPAVVGLEKITKQVESGDVVILDGSAGIIIVNPSREIFREYLEKQHKFKSFEKELIKYRLLPAETKEGYRIKLSANVELLPEVPSAKEHGAEGIGLYRTEFLYLNRTNLPSEEEHYQTYRRILEQVAPHAATIRTLDLGGDKFLSDINVSDEINPVMGLRAIRLCLQRPEIFQTQLAGILRASVHGKAKIMFPLISGLDELQQAKEMLEDTKKRLRKEGRDFDSDIEVGIMIEVPSAAAIADILAHEVSFFSIGTNDLIQYSLGIDRVNEHVAYLYEPFHPSLIRIIKVITDAGHKLGVNVSMCGEMAGEPMYIPLLLGLGMDELSMNPLSIPRVKRIMRSISLQDTKYLVKKLLTFGTAIEIRSYMLKWMQERFPEDYGLNSIPDKISVQKNSLQNNSN